MYDTVLFHHTLEVRLEHAGHLNHELLDAQRSVLRCFLLALFALLDGQRRERECADLQPGRNRKGKWPRALYMAAPRTGTLAASIVNGRLRSLAAEELLTRDATLNIKPTS
jgi:hypothetical protein